MHHLTPEQLAQKLGSDPQDVLEQCRRLGVPILHGRIDRVLFEEALRSGATVSADSASQTGAE